MLEDDRAKQTLRELRRAAEKAPLQLFHAECLGCVKDLASNTCHIGDIQVTYVLLVRQTCVVRQVSISTPLKSANHPIIKVSNKEINFILEALGFQHREPDEELLPRATKTQVWLASGRWPSINYAELVGESDEDFVARILKGRSEVAASPVTYLC